MNHNEIKARLLKAESVEDAIAVAKEADQELTAEQAEKLFQEIQACKAADPEDMMLDLDELETVAGGTGCMLPGICKGTVDWYSAAFDENNVLVGYWTHSTCFFGSDFCRSWTDTYEDSVPWVRKRTFG